MLSSCGLYSHIDMLSYCEFDRRMVMLSSCEFDMHMEFDRHIVMLSSCELDIHMDRYMVMLSSSWDLDRHIVVLSSCEFDWHIAMLSSWVRQTNLHVVNEPTCDRANIARTCLQNTTNMRAVNHTLCVTNLLTIARNGLQNTDMRSALMFVFVKTLQGWAYRKQPNARCIDERPVVGN